MVDQQWDPSAAEFGQVVEQALADAGGHDLVMSSEIDPAVRTGRIAPLLDRLGVFDLDPTEDELQLQAAAAACRAAGGVALPYPVAERLSSPWDTDEGPSALALVGDTPRIAMGDLPLRWYAVTPAGRVHDVAHRGGPVGGRLGPFVTDATLAPGSRPAAPHLLPTALVLNGFTLLGMVQSAFRLTHTHVRERIQFGAPLIEFQVVQHDLADVLVAIRLFERQLTYALWSLARGRDGMLVDAVGARVAGLRAADVALRVGHQLHGATGFCDESAISWISRHSQPLRRMPLTQPATERWLAALITERGFDGPFRGAGSGATPSPAVNGFATGTRNGAAPVAVASGEARG